VTGHCGGTSPFPSRRRTGGTCVGYSGRAAIRKEQCDGWKLA
jgi:hypothetical protein